MPDRLRVAATWGAGFAVWVLLTTAFSPHPPLAFFGKFATANGALLTLALLGSWAIGVTIGAEVASILTWTLLGAGVANAAVSVGQSTFAVGLIDGRAPGFFDNPVYLAGFLVAATWIATNRAVGDIRWGLAVVVLSAGIQASGSRVAVLLLGVVIVGALLTWGWRKAAVVAVCLITGLALGGVLGGVAGQATGTSRIAGGTAPGGFESRLEAWSSAGHAIASRPVQGQGPGRFLEATGRFRTLRFAKAEGSDRLFVDAHNIVVEYAVTTGLVGAALLLVFLAMALALAGWRSPLAGFAVLGLAMHLVEPQYPQLTPIVFLALGAAAARRRPLRVAGPPPVRAVLALGATALAVVLVVGTVKLNARPKTLPAAYATARSARTLLPVWSQPLDLTAYLDDVAGRADPGAAQRAVVWRQRAAAREPDSPAEWNALALAEERAQTGDPEADFRTALEHNPWSVTTLNNLGQFLAKAGRGDEAKSFFSRSLQVDPDQPAVRQYLKS